MVLVLQHANNETQLQILHNKIDTEVANLRTTYEQYRNDIFKYAGGEYLFPVKFIF